MRQRGHGDFKPGRNLHNHHAQLGASTAAKITAKIQAMAVEDIFRPAPPSLWSVFMKAIRTNNEIEGWHLGLNRRASGKSQIPLYLLISLLHREARRIALQIRLVSERKLRGIQKKKFRQLQTKIFGLSDEYQNGERGARQLLKACSYLNGPAAS